MHKKNLCKDGSLFLGVNYWSSRDAIKMWENWDVDVIEQDFKCLIENSKAFSDNCGDNYSVWYRPLFAHVKGNHAVNIDSKVLRVSEHQVDNNTRTAVAINYSYNEVNAVLDLEPGWKIEKITYGKCNGNVITVPPCDAVVLTLTR